MKVLALENSTTRGSIALLHDDEPIFFQYENDRKHSGAFFQSLEGLAHRHLATLDAIVVGLGPGSYAGARIAIASAIGLRARAGAKLLGWPSICAMEDSPNEYCVIGDARRNSFYFARISANQIVEGIDLHSEDELRQRLCAVTREVPLFSSEKLPQFPQANVRYPSALVLGKIAERGMIRSQEISLEPIYLREPHITTPNDKRKLPLLG